MSIKISQPEMTVWLGFFGFFVGILLNTIYGDESMPAKSWLFALAAGLVGTIIGHFIKPRGSAQVDVSSQTTQQLSTQKQGTLFSSIILFLTGLSLLAFIPSVLMLFFTFSARGVAHCSLQAMKYFCLDVYVTGPFVLVTGCVTALFYFLYRFTARR